jgi:putative NIF3 family GTP cyclohydrolase 1 type 2
MIAREIVLKIRENLGIPWQEKTFRDTFKAGNPDIEVKGIATTCMATLEQIQRAHAAGLNMIITHEPTFWTDAEQMDLSADPVYKYKSEYCLKNNIVIWRYHDHLHSRKPDVIVYGALHDLGFEIDKSQAQGLPSFTIPETTLAELAARVRTRLHSHAFRVVGDPAAKVSRIAFGVGGGMPRFSENVDVVFGGEGQEVGGADNTGYALDAVSLGMAKGFILMGHIVSEESGMEYVAPWLKTFLPNLPIQFVPARELFWDLRS